MVSIGSGQPDPNPNLIPTRLTAYQILKFYLNVNDSSNPTQVVQNEHTLFGPTVSVYAGHGTKGLSDVQTSTDEPLLTMNTKVKFHGVHMTALIKDGLSVIATKLGTLVMLDSYTSDKCMQSWGRSSYARAVIELRVDVELKDTIVEAMPKLVVFGHVLDERPKQIVSDVVKILKNPRQVTKGVQVGPKVGFKPTKQVYRFVSNMNGSSSSGKKKQADLSHEVARKGSLNMVPDSSSTTRIVEKIDKLEQQILDGKLMFVDDDEKPLYKADFTGIADSDSKWKRCTMKLHVTPSVLIY
nr:hypothetical protein [Tanacetum cinerariifolium]